MQSIVLSWPPCLSRVHVDRLSLPHAPSSIKSSLEAAGLAATHPCGLAGRASSRSAVSVAQPAVGVRDGGTGTSWPPFVPAPSDHSDLRPASAAEGRVAA